MADLTSKRRFPVSITFHEQQALDSINGNYTQYIVAANNFIIASFVDEVSRRSYSDYLKNYGFDKFPANIRETIRVSGMRQMANETVNATQKLKKT